MHKHKKHLGKSINLRDESILHRKEFGHWELDTVRGVKGKQDEVIVSLLERKTRVYITLRSPSAKATDIAITLQNWLKRCNEALDGKALCKTITSDNGLEFSSITTLENDTLQIFLLIPMPHGSVALMKGTMDYCVASSLKIDQFTRCLKQLLNEQQTGVIHCPERFSVTYRTPQEAFLEEVKKLT